MADKYLGSYVDSNEFKIQELIRTLDATLKVVNPEGAMTGQNCLSIIKFISSFEGFKEFVSPEFVDCISSEIKNAESKTNVRDQTKRVLMYPRDKYLPWKEVNVSSEILEEIRKEAECVEFMLRVVDGTIYGRCVTSETLDDITFGLTKHICEAYGLKPNPKACHITIINANIVASVGAENVFEFVQEFNQEFTVVTGKIKSTFSEDYTSFGECYVVEIECPYIDKFLEEFNHKFEKNVKIAKHVTFAVQPRSLWV